MTISVTVLVLTAPCQARPTPGNVSQTHPSSKHPEARGTMLRAPSPARSSSSISSGFWGGLLGSHDPAHSHGRTPVSELSEVSSRNPGAAHADKSKQAATSKLAELHNGKQQQQHHSASPPRSPLSVSSGFWAGLLESHDPSSKHGTGTHAEEGEVSSKSPAAAHADMSKKAPAAPSGAQRGHSQPGASGGGQADGSPSISQAHQRAQAEAPAPKRARPRQSPSGKPSPRLNDDGTIRRPYNYGLSWKDPNNLPDATKPGPRPVSASLILRLLLLTSPCSSSAQGTSGK